MRVQRLVLKLRAILSHARSRIAWSRRNETTEVYAKRHENGNGHHRKASNPWLERPKGLAFVKSTRGRVILFWVCIAALVLFFFNPFAPSGIPPDVDLDIPRHFRLLIPASHPDTTLCKTLLSAAILGYPPPVILNWNKTYKVSNQIFGGSHLDKIPGVLEYLKTLDKKHDHDLVVLVDAYDVWFQLRPNVLIERFLDMNKKANERLRKQYGGVLMTKANLNQRVIFSAQKRCWPKESNHPACWLAPESTLPRDIYGPGTDQHVDDPANVYAKYRQKYLNSGSVVGTVANLRKVFQRASDITVDDKNLGSDQGVFAQIFAEQEFHRHELAKDSRSIPRRLLDFILKVAGGNHSYKLIDPDAKDSHDFVSLSPKQNYEFGIGLDYQSRLVHATVFSEEDTAWVVHQDKDAIARISQEKNVLGRSRVEPLPKEVRTSRVPFHDLGDSPQSSDGAWNAWEQIPLFTNMWTGISPVAVHHNAHHSGLKSRLSTDWNQTWFFPYGRRLLNGRLLDPVDRPVAITRGIGPERKWLSPSSATPSEHQWAVLTTDHDEKLHFTDICKNAWEELFRDGDRTWRDPRNI